MGLIKVRIGARSAKSPQEVIDWLSNNVGSFSSKHTTGITGIIYFGKNWAAHWKPYGSGWFLDVSFYDLKDATFFTLRWK